MLSGYFDFVVFLLLHLDCSLNFMSVSYLFLELHKFVYKGLTLNPGNGKGTSKL